MARPRKIISINKRHLTRQERLDRQIAETEYKAADDALDGTPSWLTPAGADEYRRIVSEARGLAIWDNLDKSVLAMYADSYARYVDAIEHLNEEGPVSKNSRGGGAPSAWLKVADSERKAILSCSTRLGLAVTDRLRLNVPKKEAPPNKFLSLIKKA